MSLLKVENLSVGYDGKAVCSGINFTLNSGDYLCVVGKNGAGKSTLMKTLLGLIKPISGKIQMDESLKDGIGYLPQRTEAQKDFPATVIEIVLSGCVKKSGLRPFYSKAEKKTADEILELLGITSLKHKCFANLSGGQQQRVLLARALCATDRILLLDEPVTGLDPKAVQTLYDTIYQLNNKKNITIIEITHDVHFALNYANCVLELNGEDCSFERKERQINQDKESR